MKERGTLKKGFVSNLDRYCKKSNLSMREVAFRVGVNHTWLSRVLSEIETVKQSDERIKKIASMIGFKGDWFKPLR